MWGLINVPISLNNLMFYPIPRFDFNVLWSTKGLLNLKLDRWMDLTLCVNCLVHRFNLFQSVDMANRRNSEIQGVVRPS
jgi:hypothetical protein